MITDAAQGIGEAIARNFACNGAKVLLTNLQLENMSAAAELINQAGGSHRISRYRAESTWKGIRPFATCPDHTSQL